MAVRSLLFFFILVTPALLVSAPASADGYKDGLKAVKKSDWPKAKSIFEPMAETGHTGALFSMGLIYQMGRGVKQDHLKALDYYMRAAENDFSPAQNNIGLMYKLGIGVPIDYAESVKWFERAAKDHTMAKRNLAEMYEKGRGTKKDLVKAAKLYLKCSDEGAPACMYKAARYLETGRGGVKRDAARALKLYYQAAASRYSLAERKVNQIEAAKARKDGKAN